MKFAVLGAGIIGLTSASRIIENWPNSSVTIFAKEFSPNTTSDISAGYWEPYCLDESSDQKNLILKWGKETYDIMHKLALSKNADKCGVNVLSAYVLQSSEIEVPFWSSIVHQFRIIDQNEINSIINNNDLQLKNGFHFITTTVNVEKYMKVLKKNLEEKGVIFKQKNLSNLSDFIDESNFSFDYIINCTGLGSRTICNDELMQSVRGHVLRVKAPWVKNCIMLGDEITYILPLDDLVVLGGTQEPDIYDETPNETTIQNIVERCSKLLPSLMNAEIISKKAGLRPLRNSGIRLELEILSTKNNTKIIHNYGHGGSGVTLAWGCASHAVELILKDLKNK